jgi:hypothetical protein
MSAGIRSELDALKSQVKHPRDRAHEERLGQTRRPRDQAVPAGHERDQKLLDDLFLPHDHLADFGDNPIATAANLVDELLFLFVSIKLCGHACSCVSRGASCEARGAS